MSSKHLNKGHAQDFSEVLLLDSALDCFLRVPYQVCSQGYTQTSSLWPRIEEKQILVTSLGMTGTGSPALTLQPVSIRFLNAHF